MRQKYENQSDLVLLADCLTIANKMNSVILTMMSITLKIHKKPEAYVKCDSLFTSFCFSAVDPFVNSLNMELVDARGSFLCKTFKHRIGLKLFLIITALFQFLSKINLSKNLVGFHKPLSCLEPTLKTLYHVHSVSILVKALP